MTKKKLTILFILLICSSAQGQKTPDKFGIYISSLNGNNFKRVLSDPHRELNHVRVSPNGEMMTFTRFNQRKYFLGLAEEDNGYLNTQVMIARIDGTEVTALTPNGKYNININSYWVPDGKGVIYMSNDNPDKTQFTLKYIDIETRQTRDLFPKIFSWVSDPHQVGTALVFPAVKSSTDVRSIWLMDLESNDVKRLTFPKLKPLGKKVEVPFPGDSDPKLSPDGKLVSFTRHHGDASFENIVLNLETGVETSFSNPGVVDVMPEWSSDGALLLFWHVDMKNFKNIGIYTVNADGSRRHKIPLPPGFHFKMPAFFPDAGSAPEAKIIFSGKEVPQIR